MRNLASIILIIAILIGGLAFVNDVHASKNVVGMISSDTAWTKANSPYSLTGPITVGNGVTLTIEAGLTVNLNGYNIQVGGSLYARGGINDNIVFTSNSAGNGNIAFTASSTSWSEQTGTGCIIENSVLNLVSISVSSASPKLSNNTISAAPNAIDGAAISIDGGSPVISANTILGDIENLNGAAPTISSNSITGGIYGMGMLTSAPIIVNNYVKGGSAHSYGIGIRADGSNVYIADNTVSGCKTGINVYDGSSVIERNLVSGNSKGIAITGDMSPVSSIIRNNTITNNTLGMSSSGNLGSITISYNNIQNNFNYSLQGVSTTNNWWGTNDEQSIRQMLSGSVSFVPFLNEPNPVALPNPDQTSTSIPNPTAPQSRISISVDTSSVLVGSTVYINGRLTDADGAALPDESVVLSYSVTSNNWVQIGSGITNTVGDYSIQWVSSASGTFNLKTEWAGNATYQGSSNTITLSFLPYNNQNVFFIESNSTVSALGFNSTTSELSFVVTGPTGTTGYVKATIAKSLLANAADTKIYIDGNQLDYTVASTTNSWILTFTYHHSTHQIKIDITTNATTPQILEVESWVWIAAAIAVIAAGLVGFTVWRIKKKQKL